MEHPYLYFNKADIPALQERFTKEPFLTRWQLMVQDADRILTQPPIGLTNTRMSLRYAATTAFVYAITGETRYAERAKQEVFYNFTLDIATGWQENSVNCTGAGLGTSNLSLSCGLVFDWCYDTLTAEEKTRFIDGFNNIVNDLYFKSLSHPDKPTESDWWVYRDHSNWCGVCHGAQGVAALAFYEESEGARKATDLATPHIHRFIANNLEEDGSAIEGAMYARYGIEFSLYYLVASCRVFGLTPERRDILKTLNDKCSGYWDLYMLAPDRAYANFGNIGEDTMMAFWGPEKENRRYEGPSSVLHAFYDAILPDGDPLLRWGADVGGSWYIWEGASPFYLLWRKDENPPITPYGAAPPVVLQDTIHFRGTWQTIMQSGKLWLAFNGGFVSPDSHFNYDLGSFILLHDKERLLIDPGYGEVDTAKHSSVVVNGLGQIKDGHGKFLQFGKGTHFQYLACELGRAYEPEAHVTQFTRHLLVVDGAYVVILDELASDRPAQFEWMLQTRKPINLFGNKAIITGDGRKMYIIPAERGEAALNEESSTSRRHAVTQDREAVKAYVDSWKVGRGSNRKPYVNRLCIKPISDTETFTFVTLLYPTDMEVPMPKAVFDTTGTLSLTVRPGMQERICFEKADGAWQLVKVNDEAVSGLTAVDRRSITPFHDTSKHDIDVTKMPPWLLGASQ